MPIDSLYQATKSSIEQGIFQLQEKLRRKNQLEFQREIAENLMHQEKMYRQQKQLLDLQRIYYDNAKYNNSLLQRTACDPYVNSVLYESGLNDPAAIGYLELKQAIRRQAQQLQYLKRLERMKEQSLALQNRATSGYRAQMYDDNLFNHTSPIQEFSSNRNSPGHSRGYDQRRSPSRPQSLNKNMQYDLPLEQDSSALLEKYSKGIRAQQYNRDMERLIEIEKRLRKMQQKPSATKSYYPHANESIVTPYQPRYDQKARQTDRTKQRAPVIQYREPNRIDQTQRAIANNQAKVLNQTVQQPLQPKYDNKAQIFQNQKIGQVINKRRPQQKHHAQQLASDKYPALDKLDNYIKRAQNRNPLIKPVSIQRPYTSKSRNAARQQVSKSNLSGLSPLKSDRAHNHHYQPYANKAKRPRAKSSKQNTSRTRNENPIVGKQVNSRLLPLDPVTQEFLQELLHKQINEKIQNRLQLLTCVFKDAKLRHERNQVEALQHRFDIEAKARRQVKAMINNDPKILRKHKMVVQ